MATRWVAGRQTILDQRTSPEASSEAWAINDRGQVVGLSRDVDASRTVTTRGTLWFNGTATDLGPGVPVGINNRGQVVLHSVPDKSGSGMVVWWRGHRTPLTTLPVSTAVGIDDAGDVAGTAAITPACPSGKSEDPACATATHAIVWHHGTPIDLGAPAGGHSSAVAINRVGQVLGTSRDSAEHDHVFLWDHGKRRDLGTLGGDSTDVDLDQPALNDRGQVVGTSQTASGEGHAFVWDRGRMTDLGAPLGPEASWGLGISPSGDAFGQWFPGAPADSPHVIAWRRGLPLDLGAGLDIGPRGLSDGGELVGNAWDSAKNAPIAYHWFLPKTWPRPAVGAAHRVSVPKGSPSESRLAPPAPPAPKTPEAGKRPIFSGRPAPRRCPTPHP